MIFAGSRARWGLFAVLIMTSSPEAAAAPKADLWARWEKHDPASSVRVDHEAWDAFLKEYLVTGHPSGVTRVRYGDVTAGAKRALGDYVALLENTAVSSLSREEQLAYWVNLYNALTVKVVLEHYPVGSIREIKISPGLFSSGPWEKKLASVEGEGVSLNDIEHRILRPLWKDSRLHYAVNCASLGCPNLQAEAYTAANAERLLDAGARDYVNHRRGARIEGGKLTVSSIYSWFQEDFGGSWEGVVEHLAAYAEGDLAAGLGKVKGRIRHDYDWTLNE